MDSTEPRLLGEKKHRETFCITLVLTVSDILCVFLSFLSPFLVSAFVSEVVPLRSLCTTDKNEKQGQQLFLFFFFGTESTFRFLAARRLEQFFFPDV